MGDISEAQEDGLSQTIQLNGLPLSYLDSADCDRVPG